MIGYYKSYSEGVPEQKTDVSFWKDMLEEFRWVSTISLRTIIARIHGWLYILYYKCQYEDEYLTH